MDTPVCDFVEKYINSGTSRLHMPGHKGKVFLGFEQYDITEIKGADALYEADGIICQSEKNASSLFGSYRTLYSTEGSSQCIKAMLYLALLNKKSDCRPVIAASRNSHKSFIYACGLLGIDIVWLWDENPDFSLCRCKVTDETLEKTLEKYNTIGVYVTSPDYSGNMLDIKSLADVCHDKGLPLLVDNAHGAYLHFLTEKCHPLDMGADMCCDSAHKTLPVLTGGAYLHIAENAPLGFSKNAKTAMEMFGSTSPSYLILQSLDYANKYLADDYEERISICIEKVNMLKMHLRQNGWKIFESDPLKLTVCSANINLSEKLRKYGIECEYEDPDYTVMMFTPENDDLDYEKIEKAMGTNVDTKDSFRFTMKPPKAVLSVRDALFSDGEIISPENAVGRILRAPMVGCPPAVCVFVSGEVVTEEAVKIFRYYGIDRIDVVK